MKRQCLLADASPNQVLPFKHKFKFVTLACMCPNQNATKDQLIESS